MRSLGPDIDCVEREGVATFAAVPLKALEKELRHPVTAKEGLNKHHISLSALGSGERWVRWGMRERVPAPTSPSHRCAMGPPSPPEGRRGAFAGLR